MTAGDFIASDANITVRDPDSCKEWYRQTFDAVIVDPEHVDLDDEEKESCIFLGWSNDTPSICSPEIL